MSDLDKIRLDQRVTELMPDINRSYAQHLILMGSVSVNGQIDLKPGHKIRPADVILITTDVINDEIPKIDIPVVYEDENCVVINKPVGVLAHSKGEFNREATVASWLYERLETDAKQEETDHINARFGIVHRLDRATSGVMICAKNSDALKFLQKQFSTRKVIKTYYAVVSGEPKDEKAIIDMPIERNPKKPQTFRVGSNGKPAQTEIELMKTNNKYSLLRLRPKTGRTHQLRVHLSSLDLPILGDALYGGQAADRLYLHSYSLEIEIPGQETQIFTAEYPSSFDKIISK